MPQQTALILHKVKRWWIWQDFKEKDEADYMIYWHKEKLTLVLV